MYEQLFDTKIATVIVMVLASLAAGAVVSRPGFGPRALVYNFVPAIAVAFYAVALVSPRGVDRVELLAGFAFEALVLVLAIRLFTDVYESAQALDRRRAAQALAWSIPIQLLAMAPLMSLDNFGIFSEGARIDYLGEAAWAKYLTYAGILLAALQAPLLARWVTLRGGLGGLGWAAVAVNAGTSTLSGSKGAVFVWLLAVVSLIDWQRMKLRWLAISLVLAVALAGLAASVMFTSELLGLEPLEFVELAVGRFFLSNDARALAFDFRAMAGASQDVLRESLRSLVGLFGQPSQQPPLGVLLYHELYGTDTGVGANGSLMALITYYAPPGVAVVAAMVAGIVAAALVWLSRSLARLIAPGLGRLVVEVALLLCLSLYSQDFLSFQLVLPMAVLLIGGTLAAQFIRRRVALPAAAPALAQPSSRR